MLPIQTERLILRPFHLRDATALAGYRSQPEVAHFQSWTAPFSLAQAEEMITGLPAETPPPAGEWQQIALERREDGIIVGDLAICPQADDARRVEIGIALALQYQRQGYAREALRGLLTGLFARGVHRVHALVDEQNFPSARLLRSVGFRYEGRFVQHMFYKGRWVTDDVFALLATEWQG